VRQAEARHPDEPVHVRLEDRPLVLLARGLERLASEREPGRVHEDVERAELLHGALDEAGAAPRVGHVGLARDVALEAVGPARAARATLRARPDPRGATRRAPTPPAPPPRSAAVAPQ